MNRSRLAALSAGAMFLVASVLVPATAFAAGNTIFVTPATTTVTPAGTTGSSITVTVSSNTAVAMTGAAAALSFDNTKLQLTAIAKAPDPVALGASWAGYPTVANTPAFITAANTAGQIPTIGWFTTDTSTLSAAVDHGIFSATFTVTATGNSTLTPVIVPGVGGFLDELGSDVPVDSIGNGTVVNTVAPTWTLTGPATASVDRGSGTSADVNFTYSVTGGDPGTTTFTASGSSLVSGAPAAGQIGYEFSPPTLSASGTTTLSLLADATAPTGPVTITITGTDGAGTTRTATLVLTVVAPNDFTISASPTSINFLAGASGTTTVTTAVGNGSPAPVTFSATIPAAATGLTAAFAPASGAVPGSSVLTLSALDSTPAGTYTVVVTAANGAYSHSANVSVTVGPPAPAGAQPVNVTGTMDGGFLGLSCPTSVTMPLVRGNTNMTNAPCVVSTNTVWQLSAADAVSDANMGFMVTGRPVDGTTTFALRNSFHVLSGVRPTSPTNPTPAYDYDHDLSNAAQSPVVAAGTNSASVSTVLSQYVAPNDRAGTYGIQVVFSAVSIF